MGNIFKDDFRDFIKCLNDCDVKYILVGGYSVILHGYSRTTGDMDVWVERSSENYKTIVMSFLAFGMPVFDMTEDAFLHDSQKDVFTFGRPPSSIDMMVEVKGLSFSECYQKAVYFEEDGLVIRTIYINDLITAKKTAGRAKDIDDLENLQQS
jgi:predicted nucleotidyltransferase